MSSKSDPTVVNSDYSQATSSNSKGSKKHKDNRNICEICKVPVSSKNLLSHEDGKKHKNNLKKLKPKLIKKKISEDKPSTKTEEKSNLDGSSKYKCPKSSTPIRKQPAVKDNLPQNFKNEPCFTTPPSATRENKSNISPEVIDLHNDHSNPHEGDTFFVNTDGSCFPGSQHNANMFNPNNTNMTNPHEGNTTFFVGTDGKCFPGSQNRNVLQNSHRRESDSGSRRHVESPAHGYQKRGHFDNFRPRGIFKQPDNSHFWQSWQGDSTNWNNMEMHFPPGFPSRFPPPSPYKKDNRYFQRPVPDMNPHSFYVDTQGYGDLNSNENFFPLDKPQYPHKFNSNSPLGGASTEKKDPPVQPNTNVVDVQDVTKAPKTLKRKKQSVRAITTASLASRSSIDSDDTLDGPGDKQEKKDSVSETTTGKRIAHWINPSNPKDEAEVRRLVTELAKSKKKENLLRLQQQSESRGERKDSTSDEMSSSLEIDKTPQSPTESQTSSTRHQNPVLISERRGSLNLESRPNVSSPVSSPTVSRSSGSKSKQHSIPSDCATTIQKKKRKSSLEQPKSKVRRSNSSSNLEACFDAVIRGNYETPPAPEPPVNNTKNQSIQEKTVPEVTAPVVKTEPVDSLENNALSNFTDALKLSEFFQNQSTLDNCPQEATMTPVESLINLFASGNVKVKNEFEDPLIDAIRTVDPAVLNRVCDNGSTTTTSKKTTPTEQPPGMPLPSVTGSLKTILKQLQKIADREQKVKEMMQEADLKIQEYQALLDEWKTKKIKFQTEEEYLGHQRNTLVKSMNDLVSGDSTAHSIQDSSLVDSTTCNTLPSNEVTSDHASLLNNPNSTNDQTDNNRFSSLQSPITDQRVSTTTSFPVVENIPTVEEEIAILPIPSKSEKIPVIDLDDTSVIEETSTVASNVPMLCGDALSDKLSEWEVLSAHQVVVNSIQVFEDYLYTCSNDSTAKRFNLKDLSETVTYQHEKKNVNNLCVEKVNGMTLVFTSCSASIFVTLFKAEDGTILNTFTFSSTVASLCRGRDKIFVGLRDGYIFTCNLKEQEEIVNIGDPIRSIALTYQGTIRILVTLAVNGNVSIRDAERNGLLIRNVKSQKTVPLFMTVSGDCIYLSGSGVMIVVEIGSARIVQHHDLPAPYTSLTVYQGNIFTTSYSGLVRCHPKEKEKVITVYYGAGNTALTCINVYNGWVFTGNRFGAIDVFKFDPHAYLPCQLGKCDLIFSRMKDLELHALLGRDHDLPSDGSKCSWRTCREKIPPKSSLEAIKCHIKEHIQATTFQDLHTLYNLTL